MSVDEECAAATACMREQLKRCAARTRAVEKTLARDEAENTARGDAARSERAKLMRMLTLDKLPSDEAFEAYTTSLDALMRERTAILELNDAIAVLAKSSAKRAATRLRLAAENEQLRSQVEGVAERALAQRIARLQSSLRRTGEEDDDDA